MAILRTEILSINLAIRLSGEYLQISNNCLKARIIAAVKNIDAPVLTRVWQELEYRIDLCRITRGAHTEHL
jgi:hypothetical protein